MEIIIENTLEKPRHARYIIIGYSRSGTTVVHLAIAGHPNVVALNDEMRIVPFFTKGISTFTHGNDLPEEKEKGYSALFDALTSLRTSENLKARGIKIACNDYAQACVFVDVLQNHLKDIKVIIMHRRDMVALYGSGQHGKKSGVMHSWYKGAESIAVNKIKISKWRFIAFFVRVNKMYEMIGKLTDTHDVLEVNYEDLLVNPSEEYHKIFSFLNLPNVEPVWLASKKVLPPPSEYITNYDDITLLIDKLEKGTVSESVIWTSRLLNHLSWRFSTFFPHLFKRKSKLR